MPTFGAFEWAIILIIIIIFFGVGRLPEVGGAIGKAIREFRRSSQGLDDLDEEKEKKGEEEEKKEGSA